jgi:hypothetical protein
MPASLAVSLGMLAVAGLPGIESALPVASGAVAGALLAARLRVHAG